MLEKIALKINKSPDFSKILTISNQNLIEN